MFLPRMKADDTSSLEFIRTPKARKPLAECQGLAIQKNNPWAPCRSEAKIPLPGDLQHPPFFQRQGL